ncbi:zinc-binding dehydrogenase [Engelhardtia mirabilis]|uniref:Alcohol dehydrogenase n=1 Tax=Engelhardtia mirabilis TaxID=2528011 RepID=A0A518BQP3_9BACT|nr:Alcohol dehydrogenase [Planctomycetes bacterium Pla133]QDV03623.1 Alcohol dehydrogenase [Planctomycetes bacterium Pla86]
MKALRIHGHGDPSVLRLDDLPDPEPAPGQVLVRVLGVSINHLDLWVRRGMPGFKVEFPRILGCDGTGEVVAVGEGVTAFHPGQKVVLEPGYSSGRSEFDLEGLDHLAEDYAIRGEHGDGFDRELVAIEQRYLCPLPDGLDPVRAAAVPLAFLTAWGMIERAQLERGETVLVIAGSSGVGSAAIQIASHLGARVLATAGSDAKRQLALDLGAESVIDHHDPDWPREVKRLTDGDGADVVVEHVGPATWSGSMRSLARLGRLVTCGGTTGAKVEITLPHLFIKNQTILGSTMGPASALPQIFDRVARGIYQPVLDAAVPMSEARAAHERLESGGVVGKIVLLPGS